MLEEKTDMEKRKMKVVPDGYALPLGKELVAALQEELDKSEVEEGQAVYVHHRDPNYSKEHGGFRPVEIYIDESGRVRYLTEFTWVGTPPMQDLAKSADFDLAEGTFQDLHVYKRIDADVASFWKVWRSNFLEYRRMGVYKIAIVDGP